MRVSRIKVWGGVVVSCMSPARRATVGFIWSVRLSEAKPSRNSRGSGPQQSVGGGWAQRK